MPVTLVDDGPQNGYLRIHIVGDATVAGLLGQVLNPEGVDLLVTEGWMHFNAGATAAATQNIGFGVAGADNAALLSAFAVNAAADTDWTVVARSAAEAAATGAQQGTKWPAAQFLTVTNAANASTGLDAYLYLRYVRLD